MSLFDPHKRFESPYNSYGMQRLKYRQVRDQIQNPEKRVYLDGDVDEFKRAIYEANGKHLIQGPFGRWYYVDVPKFERIYVDLPSVKPNKKFKPF